MSFGKGQSAVHTAAYNAREQLYQEREGRATRDYGKNHDAPLFEGIFAPKDAPEWAHDRQELWNRAEAAERQKNGQPARNVIVAFPHQLDQEQREWLIKDFAREQFARKGMVADVAMHAPDRHGDDRNFHAHLLVTMRKIDGQGFAKTKCREWNSKEQLNEWRAQWAERGADALLRAGFEIEAERWRHGHQTLAEQRKAALARGDNDFAAQLEGEAGLHKGAKVTAMERRGASSERLERLQGVMERNDIRLEARVIDAALKELSGMAEREPPAKEPPRRQEPPRETPKEPPRQEPPKAATPPREDAPAAKGHSAKGIDPVGKAGKVIGGLAGSFLKALMGESSPPSRAQGNEPEADPPPHVREEADRAKRMQEILRDTSQVVPPEIERDVQIERDRKQRDERERER